MRRRPRFRGGPGRLACTGIPCYPLHIQDTISRAPFLPALGILVKKSASHTRDDAGVAANCVHQRDFPLIQAASHLIWENGFSRFRGRPRQNKNALAQRVGIIPRGPGAAAPVSLERGSQGKTIERFAPGLLLPPFASAKGGACAA